MFLIDATRRMNEMHHASSAIFIEWKALYNFSRNNYGKAFRTAGVPPSGNDRKSLHCDYENDQKRVLKNHNF